MILCVSERLVEAAMMAQNIARRLFSSKRFALEIGIVLMRNYGGMLKK